MSGMRSRIHDGSEGMKWIYRILRLFFCPHRYEILGEHNGERMDGALYRAHQLKCKRCGICKMFRIY